MPSNNSPRKYAEGTDVPANKTRMEIEDLLKRAGATAMMNASKDGLAMFQFTLRSRLIRFSLKLPDEAKQPREVRRRWRVLLLTIKGKLEAVRDESIETFEQAFLAHTVMPDGRTVSEAMLPQLEDAYRSGRQPALSLALPSPPTAGGPPRG